MERINRLKAAVSAVLAALTALWGWFGWLVLVWIACITLDYVTGTCAALKQGQWSSRVAREGLWHKAGSIAAVLAAALMDLAVGQILSNLPDVQLPFEYTVFLCPLVVVWYVLTEAGSIVENAGTLGAPVPGLLKRAIAAFRDQVDQSF